MEQDLMRKLTGLKVDVKNLVYPSGKLISYLDALRDNLRGSGKEENVPELINEIVGLTFEIHQGAISLLSKYKAPQKPLKKKTFSFGKIEEVLEREWFDAVAGEVYEKTIKDKVWKILGDFNLILACEGKVSLKKGLVRKLKVILENELPEMLVFYIDAPGNRDGIYNALELIEASVAEAKDVVDKYGVSVLENYVSGIETMLSNEAVAELPEKKTCPDNKIYWQTLVGRDCKRELPKGLRKFYLDFCKKNGDDRNQDAERFFVHLTNKGLAEWVSYFMGSNLEWAECLCAVDDYVPHTMKRGIEIAKARKDVAGRKARNSDKIAAYLEGVLKKNLAGK